jgi:hypothetical protein
VYPGFGMTKQNVYFESLLTTFEASSIIEAAGTIEEIASSLKPNYCSHIKLVQIFDTNSIFPTVFLFVFHNMIFKAETNFRCPNSKPHLEL